LAARAWPGNVRELKNAVERAVIMARGEKISLVDVMPRHLRTPGESGGALTIPVGSSLSDARRRMFLQTLSSTGGDISRTAKLLGVGEDEVRRELTALLDGAPAGSQAAVQASPPPAASRTAAKKTTTRKR
jgi:DNA-binding NtrC family response regulator